MAVNNQLKSTQYVLDQMLVRFINHLQFAKTANRSFEHYFKDTAYRSGNTIQYRLDNFIKVGTGSVLTPQSYKENLGTLAIDLQLNSGVEFNSQELTFERLKDPVYMDQITLSMARAMANKVEEYIGDKVQGGFNYAIWTGALNNASPFDAAKGMLAQYGVPTDNLFAAINQNTRVQLNKTLYNSFNDKINTAALINGFVGELFDLQFFCTNFLGIHHAGVGGGQAAGADGRIACGTFSAIPVSGTNILSITGLPASTVVIKKGDVIEIDTVYGVNPISKKSTTYKAQFTASIDITSTSTGEASVATDTSIVYDPTDSNQNVSAAPAIGSKLYIYDSHNVAVVYDRDAIVFAMPKMATKEGGVVTSIVSYDEDYKINMRYEKGADIMRDVEVGRLDALAGATINQKYGARLMLPLSLS